MSLSTPHQSIRLTINLRLLFPQIQYPFFHFLYLHEPLLHLLPFLDHLDSNQLKFDQTNHRLNWKYRHFTIQFRSDLAADAFWLPVAFSFHLRICLSLRFAYLESNSPIAPYIHRLVCISALVSSRQVLAPVCQSLT